MDALPVARKHLELTGVAQTMRAMMARPDQIGHGAGRIHAKWVANGIVRKKNAEAVSGDQAARLPIGPSNKRLRDEFTPSDSADEPASQRHKMESLEHRHEAAMGAIGPLSMPGLGLQDSGPITKPGAMFQPGALWKPQAGNCPDGQSAQATENWLHSYVQCVTGEHAQPNAAVNADIAPQHGAKVAHNNTMDPTRRQRTAPMTFRPQQGSPSSATATTEGPVQQPATPAEEPAGIDEDEPAYTQPGKTRISRSTQPSSTALYLAQKRQQAAAETSKPQEKSKSKKAPLMKKAMRLYGRKCTTAT